MKVKDICQILDSWAPEIYAEDFDNVGLIVGDPQWISNKIIVTVDTTEEVVQEAYRLDCKLIISFHPVIFKGLKRLTQTKHSERTIIMALRYNIAIYVIHTNLDNHPQGTNYQICRRLGLIDSKILIPNKKKGVLKKLITYIPKEHADQLREELFKSGAGRIGDYDCCSYNINGWGTFMGNEQSSPIYGEKGILCNKEEIAINVVFPAHLESYIIKTLLVNHPYEEIPYEIIQLHNPHHCDIGLGRIGRLPKPIPEDIFLSFVKERMQTPCIRHSPFLNKFVEHVAVLGGSGSFALSSAKDKGADVFISSDFKYHQFFDANNEILILDIGHYESEQFTKNLLVDVLRRKLPNFVIIQSNTRTNPIHYFY